MFINDPLSYKRIQERLNVKDYDSLPPMRIVVLRNITIEAIESFIRYFALDLGFNATVRFGQYDNIFQEATSEENELIASSDCIFLFTHLENLSKTLVSKFPKLSSKQIAREIDRIDNYVTSILSGIRKKTNSMILWHGFLASIYPNLGIADNLIERGQNDVILELNENLRKALRSYRSSYYVDMTLCLERVGYTDFCDDRYWHIGGAPYGKEALIEIAREDMKYIRASTGKSKKCVVLDCDNTLWGGIVGEVGIERIKLGPEYPGSPFYDFQQELVNLYNRGIILTICSKNNEEDVWEVFEKHPNMILKKTHIATSRINWNDKASNIIEIAEEMNIGVDSLVFLDDSEFEINLVKQAIPDISVIHLPANTAARSRATLSSCGLFDSLTFSEEDKRRGEMYKGDMRRKEIKRKAVNLESYLESLEMTLEIKFSDDLSIPRIAQLTQKTNQFNLTTKRYTEADIEGYHKSKDVDVVYLYLEDRFGSLGIVGVSIVKYQDECALIDTFLLSCRAIGRDVESVLLDYLCRLAKNRKANKIVGEYIPSSKNKQVSDFYELHGFRQVDDNPISGGFVLKLNSTMGEVPSHFKRITTDLEKVSDDIN